MDGHVEQRVSSRDVRVFGVGAAVKNPLIASAIDRLFGLAELEATYRRMPRGRSASDFVEAALGELELSVDCRASDLERIPAQGPLIVVANHPFGGVEGLLLAQLLGKRRPDLKIVASYLLERIPELRDLFIFVDPWATRQWQGRNARGLLAALRHVRQGGALAIFPAGEVAHYEAGANAVVEMPWHPSIGRMIQAAKAPVLPVFFHGANTPAFHLAGLVHPALRTALLPHELLGKRGRRIDTRIGRPIGARALPKLEPKALCAYLRDRTEALRFRSSPAASGLAPARGLEPIAEAIDPELVAADIEGLSEDHVLVRQAPFRVIWARAPELPHALLELGRLRELAFRAIGEGTGRTRDLDRFDASYRHLVLWSETSREIVGAYRVGLVDELLAQGGPSQLYSSSLFELHPWFFAQTGASIELGRSFVRTEEQGSPAPLALLWKGLGRIASLHPRYRHLFGPCSISDAYTPLARELMIDFFERAHRSDLRHLVRPRVPHRKRMFGASPSSQLAPWISDLRALSSWVSHVEPDEKGVPVLLQHYVRVGGKLLGFSVDPAFCCVDGFVLVDLLDTPRRTLELFMDEQRTAEFLAHHVSACGAGRTTGSR